MAIAFSKRPYAEQRLTYLDGRLIDQEGNAVMMAWEKPIMERAAQTVCSRGGTVCNIGFGMGLIDSAIEKHQVDQHVIIESHLDVWEKMRADGWLNKPNVKCFFGRWQDVFPAMRQLNVKLDGLYYDTWSDWGAVPELLYRIVHDHMADGGIFSYFNNPKSNDKFYLLNRFFRCKCESFPIDVPQGQHDSGATYWPVESRVYQHPICERRGGRPNEF